MAEGEYSVFGDGYPPRARDLTRYADDPLDQRIATLVHSAAEEDLEAWIALRARLSTDDQYGLMLFADRQSILALRTGESMFAGAAIRALALLDADRVDYRDLDVDFPLYALQATHGDQASAIAFAISHSHSVMRRLFKGRAGRRLSLADCGWHPVHTRHGLGFIQRWGPIPQDPSLLGAAAEIADRIDAREGYEGTAIHLSTLGWVWFRRQPVPPARRLDEIPTKGCVSVTSDYLGEGSWKHGLRAFVADVEDAATARALVDLASGASRVDAPRHATSHGARLLVIEAGTRTVDEPADAHRARFADLARDLSAAAFAAPVLT